MSELVLVVDFSVLAIWLLAAAFRYLVRRDTYHGWVRSAAGRLSCRLCGKTPHLEEDRWREDFA